MRAQSISSIVCMESGFGDKAIRKRLAEQLVRRQGRIFTHATKPFASLSQNEITKCQRHAGGYRCKQHGLRGGSIGISIIEQLT